MKINNAELERRRRQLLFFYQTRQAGLNNAEFKNRTDLFNRVSSIGQRSIQEMTSTGSKGARKALNDLMAKPKDRIQEGQVNSIQKSPSLSSRPFIHPDRYV